MDPRATAAYLRDRRAHSGGIRIKRDSVIGLLGALLGWLMGLAAVPGAVRAAIGAVLAVVMYEVGNYVFQFVWVAPREMHFEALRTITRLEAERDTARASLKPVEDAQLSQKKATTKRVTRPNFRFTEGLKATRIFAPRTLTEMCDEIGKAGSDYARAEAAKPYYGLWLHVLGNVRDVYSDDGSDVVQIPLLTLLQIARLRCSSNWTFGNLPSV